MALSHLFSHIRTYGLKHKPLYALAMMILFFSIFNGIVAYITPLLMEERGLSKTMLGIIYGMSSVSGALFDFLLCRFLTKTNFRRVFIFMFAICLVYPLILLKATTAVLFIIPMALWGLYYDFYQYGRHDFVGRYTKHADHSSSYGIMEAALAVGYMIAPLIAGFLIGEAVGWKPAFLGWIFLLVAISFFLLLLALTKKGEAGVISYQEKSSYTSFFMEIHVWKRIGKVIFPALAVTLMLNIVDSFFWTIGPLLSESLKSSLGNFEGILITAYFFPMLIVGWLVGPITKRFGKKRTAFWGLLVGSAVLMTFSLSQSVFVLIACILVASTFLMVSWPSINGAYADYISEAPKIERELQTISDFSGNLGYVIGPITAGILADLFGNIQAFTIIGFIGIIVSLSLIKYSPKKINVRRI